MPELAYGGLSPATVARLDAIAADERNDDRDAARKKTSDRPVPATRLVREWQGSEHAVTVLAEGFEYLGRPKNHTTSSDMKLGKVLKSKNQKPK